MMISNLCEQRIEIPNEACRYLRVLADEKAATVIDKWDIKLTGLYGKRILS